MPYSGSTILSFLLGSHSRVYNGADLHHLNAERRGTCSIHKDECPALTPQALERIYASFDRIDEWYDQISSVTSRPYICDASKQLSFFSRALIETDKPLALVLLKKHPIRSAASDLHNRYFAKQVRLSTIEDIRNHLSSEFSQALTFIDNRLRSFQQHYEQREALIAEAYSASNVVATFSVAYEDIVAGTEQMTSSLLAAFDLEMEPNQVNYTEFEHHPVTGNLGPVWKVRQARANKGAKGSGEFRKNFYLNTDQLIIMDNKYQELFSVDQIAQIENLDSYKKLIDELGYQGIGN